MKSLEECCQEFRNSPEPSHECIASLVAYAYCDADGIIMGLAQVGVKRDFLSQKGKKILLPCHKGRGLDITKAFLLFAHAEKHGVSVYICGDERAEKLR